MNFTNQKSNFKSSKGGLKIFYQSWTKPDATKVFIFQHGFGEHSDRYKNLLTQFADGQYNFYALDARGHGRSEGIRGHVDSFNEYVSDLNDLIEIAKSKEKVNKVYLLGHSLGGVISLKYAIEHQKDLHALVVSAPALKVKMDIEKEIKKFAAQFFSILLPSFILDANINSKLLSHDPKVVMEYNADELVHGKVSFKMGYELFNISDSVYPKAGDLTVPMLVVHGEADGIADVEGSKQLFKYLKGDNKILKTYPGLYHEMMNELSPDKDKVISEIRYFMDGIK